MNFSVLVLSNPFCLLHMTPSRHSFLRNFKASHPSGPKKKKKKFRFRFCAFPCLVYFPNWTLTLFLHFDFKSAFQHVDLLFGRSQFAGSRELHMEEKKKKFWPLTVALNHFNRRDAAYLSISKAGFIFLCFHHLRVSRRGHTRTHTDFIYEN